ncbi:MAG: hypothetical protein ACOC2F_06580 [Bacteroidota bacterium]
MDLEKRKEKLLKELISLERIIGQLDNTKNTLQIDLDLALDKIRGIYDNLLNWNNNQGFDFSDDTDKQEVEASSINENKIPKDVDEVDEKQQNTEDLKNKKDDKPIGNEVEPAEKKKLETEKRPPGIIADKFQEQKKFINETLADKTLGTRKDLSSVLQSKPIRSIESAIGLNDKFLFIKELFDGNAEHFKKVVHKLNEATNFNEAFNYLNENFDWDVDDPVVQKLLDLVRRRHIIK